MPKHGQSFWSCYLEYGHPDRCGFRQWEEELPQSTTSGSSSTSSAARVSELERVIAWQQGVIKELRESISSLQTQLQAARRSST